VINDFKGTTLRQDADEILVGLEQVPNPSEKTLETIAHLRNLTPRGVEMVLTHRRALALINADKRRMKRNKRWILWAVVAGFVLGYFFVLRPALEPAKPATPEVVSDAYINDFLQEFDPSPAVKSSQADVLPYFEGSFEDTLRAAARGDTKVYKQIASLPDHEYDTVLMTLVYALCRRGSDTDIAEARSAWKKIKEKSRREEVLGILKQSLGERKMMGFESP